jgi:hypothetical protein
MESEEPENEIHEVSYGLILPFDSDDLEFCRGWEAASCYEKLKAEPMHRVRFQLHSNNIEMMWRIGETLGRQVTLLSDTDDWLDVEFGAAI